MNRCIYDERALTQDPHIIKGSNECSSHKTNAEIAHVDVEKRSALQQTVGIHCRDPVDELVRLLIEHDLHRRKPCAAGNCLGRFSILSKRRKGDALTLRNNIRTLVLPTRTGLLVVSRI